MGSIVEVVRVEQDSLSVINSRLKIPWVEPPRGLGIGMKAMPLKLRFLMMLLPDKVIRVVLSIAPCY